MASDTKTAPPVTGSNDPSTQQGSTGSTDSTGGTQGSTGSTGSTQSTAQAVGSFLLKALVTGTRAVVVPLAEVYARPPDDQKPSDGNPPNNALTANEAAALTRAAAKFVAEAGQLLMSNFSPVPAGSTYSAPVADQNGHYPEPSLGALVAAVKGVMVFQTAQKAKKAADEQKREQKSENEALRPVTMNTLRAAKRG